MPTRCQRDASKTGLEAAIAKLTRTTDTTITPVSLISAGFNPNMLNISTSRVIKTLALVLLLGMAAGCVTDTVSMGYKSGGQITPDNSGAAASVGTFLDQRGETPTWIGAVRGGYGNPLKTLETDKPVSTLVQNAFSDGLKERGLLATGPGAYQISGVIKKLDCSQYVRREAHAIIDVSVFDPSGKQVFTQSYTADELQGSLMALNVGVFGNVDTLRLLAEKTLDEVVDKALDDTALRNAIRHQ